MEKTTVVVLLVIGVMSSRYWAIEAWVRERVKALEVQDPEVNGRLGKDF